MKTMIITALFDIQRDTRGDGRTIFEYLTWLKTTLKVKCDMTIFTEKKFEKFIYENRKDISFKTDIIVQNLTDLPFYKYMDTMTSIMRNPYYHYKMRDPRRVECILPEYNLIQYSKFGWLENAAIKNPNHEYFFWMDAGCSRFFLDVDLNKDFPNISLLNPDKFMLQRNTNFPIMWDTMNPLLYIWDNRAMICGGMFGAGRDPIFKVKKYIEEICETIFFKNGCINNEQFALAIACKLYPEIFTIEKQTYDNEEEGTYCIPLFKRLSN